MFKHDKQLVLADMHETVIKRYEPLRCVKRGMSLSNEGRNRENRNGAFSARRVQ